jgi:hypothetical protein
MECRQEALWDAPMQVEIGLIGELMCAVAQANRQLTEDEIDRALGLAGAEVAVDVDPARGGRNRERARVVSAAH